MPLFAQIINMLAALFLLIAFAMLSQRRIANLINLYTIQGLVLSLSIVAVAYGTRQTHLYLSAALNFTLKVIVVPWILRRLVRKLEVQWDRETLVRIPTIMLLGLGLVIFAFNASLPIANLAGTINHNTLGIALASVLLSFLMMILRATAISQVIGFLALENGLIFAATSVTYGMPMVIELGIALDVIVGVFILGVFFFHIREQFDSLDLHYIDRHEE
ncbi:MAG: formate hydrogenlyase [Acidiferrobacter sp.]